MEDNMASTYTVFSADSIKNRRFSGTVGSDKEPDLILSDLRGNMFNRLKITELNAHIFDSQHRSFLRCHEDFRLCHMLSLPFFMMPSARSSLQKQDKPPDLP